MTLTAPLQHCFSKRYCNTPPICIAMLFLFNLYCSPFGVTELSGRGNTSVLLPCLSQYASHLYYNTCRKSWWLVTEMFPQNRHFSKPLYHCGQNHSKKYFLKELFWHNNCFVKTTNNLFTKQIPSHVLLQTGTNQWQQQCKENVLVESFLQ